MRVMKWGSFQALGRTDRAARDFVRLEGEFRNRTWRVNGVPLAFLEGIFRSLIGGVVDIVLTVEDAGCLGAYVIEMGSHLTDKQVFEKSRAVLKSNLRLLPDTIQIQEKATSLDESACTVDGFKHVTLEESVRDELIVHFATPRGRIVIESDAKIFYSYAWNGIGHGAVSSAGQDMLYNFGLDQRNHK